MSEPPDYSSSRAILIATANYEDDRWRPLPAAVNSLRALRQVLAAPELSGWPDERITLLHDPTERHLLQTLRRLARDTDDVLLVYFVGHGLLRQRGQLCLVLADTDFDDSDITSLEYQRVREVLLDSPARIKIVILDCCYSGRAIEALSGNDVADYTDTQGVYTLTASDLTAHVEPLERQRNKPTSFTGELVGLIREGIPGGPEHLPIGTLYVHLRHRLHRRGLPTPNQRGTDTADQFPFTRNVAYRRKPAQGERSHPLAGHDPPGNSLEPEIRFTRWLLGRGRAVVLLVAILVAMAWTIRGSAVGKGSAGSPPQALNGSPTFDNMQRRGGVIIGVRADQPGLGYMDNYTGRYSGFDIEIAKLIAAELGFNEDKIAFKTVAPAEREQEIAKGALDYYVGTYVINDKRKQQVAFAGPYYVAGQDLLVRKADSSVTRGTLKGKRVCSVMGTTTLQRVRDQGLTEPSNIVEFPSYNQCIDSLLTHQVDAVTTDDALLKGLAAEYPDVLRVVGQPFSEEPYGVGMRKDDKALRDAVNGILQRALDNNTWQSIYDRTLGKSGTPAARMPTIQRY